MAASSRTGSWGDGMLPLDCVVFMLVRNGQVLAEKRKATRRLAPGAIALPGGHVDAGEGLEDALHRELHEELGVVAERTAYVCTLLHRAEELRKLHYFAVEGWRGEIFHWIHTAPGNRLARCKVKDPSLQNWPALSEAILGNIIPDFPVVNKSFNLSYSGTDR